MAQFIKTHGYYDTAHNNAGWPAFNGMHTKYFLNFISNVNVASLHDTRLDYKDN